MKQKVPVTLVVEFSDDVLQPDVNEALQDAVKGLKNMLVFLPAVKGKTKGGKTVAFKITEIEPPIL